MQGTPSIAASQVATSTSAGLLLAARANRRAVWLANLDATNHVFVGADSGVSTANGYRLKAGDQPIRVVTRDELWAIASAGTPTVALLEELD
jgi:hypothetical protein